MSDLEDLVREELRARVAAAEAAATDEPQAVMPGGLLGGLNRRIRAARLRRRWAASALSAVAVAAAVILPLTLLSPGAGTGPSARPSGPGSVPLTGTAATPAGWAPVTSGTAQISVPADWRVATRPVCDRKIPGYVVLGSASTTLVVRNPRCRQAPEMAAILRQPSGRGQSARPTGVTNGIPVVRVHAERGFVSYLVPTLHVAVTARGPLARRVLATLTRSPLSVVLARGRSFPVPGGWRWHGFRGISFAAPARWALVRNGHWGCPFPTVPATVILIPAANTERPRCPVMFGVAGPMTAHVGVIAGAGPSGGPGQPGYDGCRLLHGLRACYSASAYNGGLLNVAVFVPGRQRATLIEIGLGNGAVARTIFDSIRPR